MTVDKPDLYDSSMKEWPKSLASISVTETCLDDTILYKYTAQAQSKTNIGGTFQVVVYTL